MLRILLFGSAGARGNDGGGARGKTGDGGAGFLEKTFLISSRL